jgi:hypothetical protein
MVGVFKRPDFISIYITAVGIRTPKWSLPKRYLNA